MTRSGCVGGTGENLDGWELSPIPRTPYRRKPRQKIGTNENFVVVRALFLNSHPERKSRDLLLRLFYVYLLASRSRVLYIGMTNDLERRVREHRLGEFEGFTKKYRVHRLVFFESFHDARTAIAREKQLKGWRREKKVALIEAQNPTWEDLAARGSPPEWMKSRSLDLRSG